MTLEEIENRLGDEVAMIIRPFAQQFDKAREALGEKYRKEAPESYETIVRDVVKIVLGEATIHMVKAGPANALVFVICRLVDHYAVCVTAGALPTIEAKGGHKIPPTEGQVHQYVLLALDVVQNMKML